MSEKQVYVPVTPATLPIQVVGDRVALMLVSIEAKAGAKTYQIDEHDAQRAGLVVQIDADHRYATSKEKSAGEQPDPGECFVFSPDAVRQTLHVDLPVAEGDPPRLGAIVVVGADDLDARVLEPVFLEEPGDIGLWPAPKSFLTRGSHQENRKR